MKSFVIGCYNFGESLDVFVEQPVWRGQKQLTDFAVSFLRLLLNVIHTSYMPLKKKPEFFNTLYTLAPNSSTYAIKNTFLPHAPCVTRNLDFICMFTLFCQKCNALKMTAAVFFFNSKLKL